ncbi:MAG TPA: glycosyltransferase family 39 protein [Phototrophicaceae bacterium]|nr:glycosyltransferase family 39 protein [Phototrophicaceae bacterium]
MTRRSLPKDSSSGFRSGGWLFLVAAGSAALVGWRRFRHSSARKSSIIVTSIGEDAPVKVSPAARPLQQILWSVGLALAAVGLMVFSASALQQAEQPLIRAVVALLLGGVALIFALHLRELPEPLTAVVPVSESHSKIQPIMTIAGFLLLLLLAEINGRALAWPVLDSISTNAQFGLLGAGIGLLGLGLGGFRLPVRLPAVHQRREMVVVVVLTILALALRFWQVDTSVRVLVDELHLVLPIQASWSNADIKLLSPFGNITTFSYMFPYWQSLAVHVFGRNFTGLRAVSAILGALTIPAVYLLGRALFERPTALIAALLLATFPPHLNFSRIGINNIADPLFGTLALAFLAQGMNFGRRRDYALAGITLGLTQYFYEGGRLLYPVLVIAWLVGMWLMGRGKTRTTLYSQLPNRSSVLILVLAAVCVALPIYYTLAASGNPLTPRLNSEYALPTTQGVFDVRAYVEQRLVPSFLVYGRQPDSTLFYAGYTPLLLAFMVPAVLLGLTWALGQVRKPGFLLLILWLLAVSVGNTLLADPTQSPRYVVVFPALMLLAAIGIRYVPTLLMPGRVPPALVGGAVAVVLAVAQVNYYFNVHLPTYNHQFREILRYRDGQDAMLRSLDFPPTTRIHLISSQPLPEDYITGLLRFMNDSLQVDFMNANELTVLDLQRLPLGADHAFYVEPEDVRVIDLIQEHFFTEAAQASPFGLALWAQFDLYYAPYVPGLSEDRLMRVAAPALTPQASNSSK